MRRCAATSGCARMAALRSGAVTDSVSAQFDRWLCRGMSEAESPLEPVQFAVARLLDGLESVAKLMELVLHGAAAVFALSWTRDGYTRGDFRC